MMAAATAVHQSSFEKTVENVNLPKQDINAIVLDYLVREGFPEAATHFVKEANLQPNDNDKDSLIDERVQIRDAIYKGDLQTAIEDINSIDPHILDGNKSLHFALLRLQLIELIKKCFTSPESDARKLVTDACDFARENLAPYTGQAEQFKIDLERAMALLIVPRAEWADPQPASFGPLSELIDPSLKDDVAKDVNAAILRGQGLRDKTRIHHILQTRAWAEQLARQQHIEIDPTSLHINLADDESSNGHGTDTQMTEDSDFRAAEQAAYYAITSAPR